MSPESTEHLKHRELSAIGGVVLVIEFMAHDLSPEFRHDPSPLQLLDKRLPERVEPALGRLPAFPQPEPPS